MGYEETSKPDMESLTTFDPVQIRSDDGREYIEGYAIRWYVPGDKGTEYKEHDMVVERIDRHACDELLTRGENTEGWLDHSHTMYLGETKLGTLFLRSDDVGLKYRIPYDPSMPDHVKAKQWINKGIVKGSSFRWGAWDVKYSREGTNTIRTIKKIRNIVELGPVRKPAYKGTSATVRSEIDAWEKTQDRLERWKKMKCDNTII